jgi:L-alanine-DL-glutamate epimerase-like enolase superfamily enzyme
VRFSLHRHRLSYADGLQVFTASSGPVPGLDTLYLRAAWSGGEGWGEARANIAYASGVPADRVPALVAEALAPLLGADEPDHALTLLDVSRAHPMARNLVECALLDGIARSRGMSVAALIGEGVERGPLRPIASNQCIFAGTPLEDAVARAARYVDEGFAAIKVRLGVESPRDEAIRVQEIRHAIGADVQLAVDANGTWSVEESVARLSLLDGLALEYVEQPTPPGDWAAFAAVRARTGLPVMADEGLKTAADAEALMRLGPPFLAHVKLPKAGGPHALLAQAQALQDAGIAVMVGQMNEGALATAATVQVAAAVRPRHAELYGAYGIVDDPARGLSYRRGAACLTHARGMGVVLDAKALPAPIWTMGS